MILLIIDDDLFTICDADSESGTNPTFPEYAIHPREADFLSLNIIHVDSNALRRPQCSLIVTVLGLLNPELLCVSKFLTFRAILDDRRFKSRVIASEDTRAYSDAERERGGRVPFLTGGAVDTESSDSRLGLGMSIVLV